MRIVVVEDEIRIREGLCNIIEKISDEYEIVGQAENGKKGANIILSENPDLIITDVKMPKMDGINMLKLLAEKGIRKKTIILSAYTEFEYAQKAITLGVSEYLVKPITVDTLTETLKRAEKQLEYEKLINPVLAEYRDDLQVYPIHIENDIKISICANDLQKANRLKESFINYFNNKNYKFKSIKEAHIRFIGAVVNISREIGAIDERRFNMQQVLDNIVNAKDYEELTNDLDTIFSTLSSTENNTEETANITVNRVKMLVHEFYQSGISLEEIADKLNMTPEYLGTLFREITGTNFSSYIRNYRVSKAKKLLLGTQMKLYEIAQSVGYSDPKYFSQVFKDCTGQLPSQYRILNK